MRPGLGSLWAASPPLAFPDKLLSSVPTGAAHDPTTFYCPRLFKVTHWNSRSVKAEARFESFLLYILSSKHRTRYGGSVQLMFFLDNVHTHT